ncbi:hypothetical protein LO762_25970 [Actinocorallia sp. API 0066]|uniref:hypothetical protein n=1 Tax=Actinocorallia sp. API 0066 TaxID=2896846 RepID=UPI001E4E3BCB|nr:hypothetical protein [Actinocorallia sp. API 0066]MCD0452603.1 hypothetical protein [Actinocorallia sp. API 0066]
MVGKLLAVSALTVSLTACGGGGQETAERATDVVATVTGAAGTPTGTPGTTAAAACPTAATKKFAKTRFVADMGLAFGAFNQWILKPYKAGGFNEGAEKRKSAIAKAVAAGAFSLNRLNAGRKMINADPTLCKSLKAPVEALWATASAAIDKLKTGDTSGITDASSALEGLRQDAEQDGLTIKDRQPPSGF